MMTVCSVDLFRLMSLSSFPSSAHCSKITQITNINDKKSSLHGVVIIFLGFLPHRHRVSIATIALGNPMPIPTPSPTPRAILLPSSASASLLLEGFPPLFGGAVEEVAGVIDVVEIEEC
jgi:hypothetical protein